MNDLVLSPSPVPELFFGIVKDFNGTIERTLFVVIKEYKTIEGIDGNIKKEVNIRLEKLQYNKALWGNLFPRIF